MYRNNFWRLLAEIWPKKTTSRDGCGLLKIVTMILKAEGATALESALCAGCVFRRVRAALRRKADSSLEAPRKRSGRKFRKSWFRCGWTSPTSGKHRRFDIQGISSITLRTLPRATGVSRPLRPRNPKKVCKKSPGPRVPKSLEKVPNRHFRDFSRLFGLFREFFQTFWGPKAGGPGRLFSDFLGFRAWRARETPVARGRFASITAWAFSFFGSVFLFLSPPKLGTAFPAVLRVFPAPSLSDWGVAAQDAIKTAHVPCLGLGCTSLEFLGPWRQLSCSAR